MSSKRSRVHPPYKTKNSVINWATNNKALVDRGNLRLWISTGRKQSFRVIANWNAKPSKRCRGGQLKYSNLAIETALTLRLPGELVLDEIPCLVIIRYEFDFADFSCAIGLRLLRAA
jgi:hypothetical protein